MQINKLELPGELEADLISGGLKFDEKSTHKLRRLLGYAKFGLRCPYFLTLQNIERENSVFAAEANYIHVLFGRRSWFRPPGNVDPTKTVAIAMLDADAAIALDYRTRPPRVVFTDEKSSNWRIAASNYHHLKLKLGFT